MATIENARAASTQANRAFVGIGRAYKGARRRAFENDGNPLALEPEAMNEIERPDLAPSSQ
ncbi:hypothetical protein GCM10022219_22080 [Microbacterium oryzae]